MQLGNLKPAPGSQHKRKRIGRGNASGWGKSAGRGDKGYHQRSGSRSDRLFEGGQMPIHRRLPKRGFYSRFHTQYEIVNLDQLERIKDKQITAETLFKAGLIKKPDARVKLLARGEIKRAVEVQIQAVSQQAKEKIEAAGGSVTLL